MKKAVKILKSSFFWAAFFIAVAAVCFLWIFLFGKNGKADTAAVYVEGELYCEISLDEDGIYEIKTSFGENTVEVKDGRVRVKSADCENRICVERGWISDAGTPIICSPHKLSVEICGEGKSDASV